MCGWKGVLGVGRVWSRAGVWDAWVAWLCWMVCGSAGGVERGEVVNDWCVGCRGVSRVWGVKDWWLWNGTGMWVGSRCVVWEGVWVE